MPLRRSSARVRSRKYSPRSFVKGGRTGTLESAWTVVDGRRMHARVSMDPVPRDRIPVVLVHGLVLSSLYLVPTAERLAPEFRVYAPDLPGFGRSEKPSYVLNVPLLADALAEWMETCGVARAALLSNSAGCQVAADLALRYPERVERLVLNAPTVDPQVRGAREQLRRLLADAPHEPPSLGLIHLRDYWTTGISRVLRTFRYLMEDGIEKKLPRVRVPTLVVRGTRDPVVPQRWAEEAVRLLPDGRLKVIPGATHATPYSSPLELVRVTRPFLLESSRPASIAGSPR